MKKECENLTLYFYGELEEQEKALFQAHLPHCPICQKELVFLQRTQEALVPPAAPQALVEAVLAQAKPVSFWRKFYKPALGLAATMAAGVCLLVLSPAKTQQPTSQSANWLAYVSVEADEEYNSFLQEFETFENGF
ncbi:MAG: zf-HC2 domain-containing protein [Elusimicrobiaceae bacterium]|nr:zf-HC2 domain-containing protein [Elusimicrobiaceae bacterium]